MSVSRHLWPVSLLLCLAACLSLANEPDAASWTRDLLAWRVQHTADLQKPDGWLALAGLEWLQPGDNSVGSAADNKIHLPAGAPEHACVLHLDGLIATLRPPAGGFPPGLLVDGKAAQPQALHVEAQKDKNNTRLTVGALSFYVIRREDRFALRIKDTKSEALVHFHGLKWYPPDPKYRVVARWTPYTPGKIIKMATLVGTTYDGHVPGAAEFNLDDKTFRLEPLLEDPDEPKLFFVLRDTTSASTTYPACRFLYTGFPDHGIDKVGELVLDFNRLENPPCAYTSYATCPLPPPQNRLPVAIPVGEQRYHD